METELSRIVSMLRQTFEKDAWHGPSVKQVIADIAPEQSMLRLRDTHSIIELVCHMKTWRDYVTHKLRGNFDFKVTPELDFPQSKNWKECMQQLDENQQQLLAAIAAFPASKLNDIVPHAESSHTFYELIHGIIQHDLYHTGQIMLIKKGTAKQSI
jgi:uncharacterized damage-inducible protein DinB